MVPARRVTLVGLAKNTGKTEALTSLAGELSGLGHSLGITSIGRDGEEADVIRPQIAKPRIHCPAGTLVATTGPLMSRCAARHEVLANTGLTTPLGSVVIGRLHEPAEVEIAGPSTSAGIRGVADTMLDLGAEHVLIDGSIDRRAASAPSIADAVVLSTGAVLGHEIDEVVQRTRRVVELVNLPRVADPLLRGLAMETSNDLLITQAGEAHALPARFALAARAADISAALKGSDGDGRTLVIRGALSERFLDALLPTATKRRPMRVIVADATKVFLQTRPPSWYRRQGIEVEVLHRVDLRAITVNPVAPLSHRLDSAGLQASIHEIAARVPVFDVKSDGYRSAASRLRNDTAALRAA